ncbi:hypothetical protein MNBD_GAMMA10-3289 [hydrothermal vent metagenome]|uniref:Ribbon-helix-helix protein CopG domain-containing protein n=1 Tax=hydrothermal vent metagenome TaxID=652676 RepID=A0A3B0XGS8_9ZZZZ
MRINARLDQTHAQMLESLKHSEHLTTTEVLKNALDLYYEQRKLKHKTNIQRLLDSDFIGCGEGSEDLSESYKHDLTESLQDKYDFD